MAPHMTRRGLLAGGAAAALSAGAGLPGARALAVGGDGAVLEQAIAVERLLAWGYERVLATQALAPAARSQVAALLGHERQHLSAVSGALGSPAAGPLSDAAARRELHRHPIGADPDRLRTQHACVRLLVDLESVAEGAWFSAVARLQDPGLARLAAQIMASEAQHWTVLSDLSHPGDPVASVPNPFVRGTQ
jgi:hypothetical protein